MLRDIRPALVMMVLLTLLCGLAYPLLITGIAAVAFPAQAGGSLVRVWRTVVGSRLIAQGFAKPEYLHPRPSAAGKGYDPTNSGGSNWARWTRSSPTASPATPPSLRKENPAASAIPADAVTTSASGLDPDVSPANARLQAPGSPPRGGPRSRRSRP